MPFIEESLTEEYIRKVVFEANTLDAMIFGEGIPVSAQPETKVEEKEAEEEPEEEEVGIGGLFG
jgi:hypothetical protein